MRIHPDKAEDVNLLNSSPGCICLWPAVLSDKQQALLRPFTASAYPSHLTRLYDSLFPVAAIRFPDLDLPARRRRWLQLFGRDYLAETISSSKHASVPTVRDTEALTFLRETVKISWYELDGMDIETVMKLARISAGANPQEVKEYLKAWGVLLSVQSRVARFFALREMHASDSAHEEPSSREHGEDAHV
ncbi:uncharacterized protein HD556DRAFT_1447686 [Suillus plorans]|uniref:Uncharacterized protein n=1 Tax=Suillus plorans TaxID=116603 RepID=A0A9P7AFZ5_9AGAM|nr:uncharacterized protein HD556DRAFT_1447686 [Suillus plorans]KAG1788654.1 hypothetical protein HD556DRAFT_1447686 [Suillus plorans]